MFGVAACLPTEDLSSYSSQYQRSTPGSEPGVVPEGAVQTAPSVQSAEATPAPAPLTGTGPEAAPLLADECSEGCLLPELPLSADAGVAPEEPGGAVSVGSVATIDVPASPVDAGVASDAATVGPCGQGALLAPDDRCFALLATPLGWDDARDACEARGAGWDLAVIRSSERNSWLAGMLSGVTDAWVGANDIAQEGSWRWVSDNAAFFTGTGTAGSATAGAYVNWNTGGTPEPNGGAASDCLRLRSTGGWADIACTSTFAALCEGPQP
jgi:hypothetical protein